MAAVECMELTTVCEHSQRWDPERPYARASADSNNSLSRLVGVQILFFAQFLHPS